MSDSGLLAFNSVSTVLVKYNLISHYQIFKLDKNNYSRTVDNTFCVGYDTPFLVHFGINFHERVFHESAVSAFCKTRKCKLIPN